MTSYTNDINPFSTTRRTSLADGYPQDAENLQAYYSPASCLAWTRSKSLVFSQLKQLSERKRQYLTWSLGLSL